MKNVFNISIIILSIFLLNACEKDKPTPPVLTTSIVTEISYTTATSGGNVTNEGGATVLSMGICWATAEKPTIANSTQKVSGATGAFICNLTGLTPNTIYYVRAYATNSSGTGYGEQVTFKTINTEIPELETSPVSEISGNSAVSGGNIVEDNGSEVIARGICWSTSANPTVSNNKTVDASGGKGTFSGRITGLAEGTVYHLRAYATNSVGTSYGADLTFTTLSRPLLITVAISDITLISATSGGNITNDGGAQVTARGVCWSTSENPTITSNVTSNGLNNGAFSSNLNGLSQGTRYFIRAYATNSVGTGYGNQLSFITNLSDIDGNVYHTVLIGTQVWLTENLKVTHYANGDDITYAGGSIPWLDITSGLYCNYNDDLNNAAVYGSLYNWYSVIDSRKLCPSGWHVPTDAEWETLGTFLGGQATAGGVLTLAGGKMKEAGLIHWTTMNVGADNSSGFTALPGGRRFDEGATAFGNLNKDGFWWSATEVDAVQAYSRSIYGSGEYLMRDNLYKKSWGFSVRCLKD